MSIGRAIKGLAISALTFAVFCALLLLMDAAVFGLMGLSLFYRG